LRLQGLLAKLIVDEFVRQAATALGTPLPPVAVTNYTYELA
jgi:hypothetical protein